MKSDITENYRQRARTQLEEIEGLARKKGVACRSLLLEGDLVQEGACIAQQEKIDLILLNQPEKSHLFRLIFGPMRESLTQRVSCPVKVVDEEMFEK
ncbi:MAG: universal stress protein [bacterium]